MFLPLLLPFLQRGMKPLRDRSRRTVHLASFQGYRLSELRFPWPRVPEPNRWDRQSLSSDRQSPERKFMYYI